jgi:uroporphyrinogen decarboxylase
VLDYCVTVKASHSSAQRFLDACYGRPVDRPPVWMMRQAGRYLPEYRKVRETASFLDLCATPELAAEVSLQPFRRFAPDGVIFFSDILGPAAALGMRVEFGDGGPELPEPVRSAEDVARLHPFHPTTEVGFTGEILAALSREVGDRAAVLGFAGAPWTLASYLVEGGGSKSFAVIKQMMGREPRTLRRLLNLLADVVGDVLSFQIESGALAVQLFDTWAGELTEEDYRQWALPATARAIGAIRRAPRLRPAEPDEARKGVKVKEEDPPVILFINGCGHLIEAMSESGAEVLSIDWRVPLSEARRRAPGLALQGNLDPGILLGPEETVTRRTREIVEQTQGRAHVVNLGHGVLPQTPVESARAFFEAVRESAAAPAAATAEARS